MRPDHMDEKTIKKGTLVNALGIGGKALLPLLFILITRLFGPERMGIFFLAFVSMDIAFNITLSGLKDGVILFISKYSHKSDEKDKVYKILANALLITLGVSALIVLFYYIAGNVIALNRYPDGKLAGALSIMIWSLPVFAVVNMITSATRGLLVMKWDAIMIGFLRPFFFCLTVLTVALLKGRLNDLATGYLIANVLLLFLALLIFFRQFQLSKLLEAFRFPLWDRSLLKFIIPQNLNTTFNTLITNLDVMMLGLFKTDPVLIGYYGMGAQIVRNVRQIKVAFAGILGPIVTRLRKDRNYPEMERLFSRIVSWTISIAFPVLFVVGVFRSELLQLFHKSFSGEALFMLVLLIPPFLSCLMGMAGDIIVMTGHVTWNLINSATVALLNCILNYFLIPEWGLMGAAVATAVSATIVYLLQLFEAHVLLSVQLRVNIALRPFLYLILPAITYALLSAYLPGKDILLRIIKTALPLLLYIPVAMMDQKKIKQKHQSAE